MTNILVSGAIYGMDIGYPVLVNAVSAAAAKITQVDSPCHSCRFLQAGVMVTKNKK